MDTPTKQAQAIAAAASEALRAAGVSQREASELTGIPLTTLVRRLTGRSPFLVTELAAVAEVAGVSVRDLTPADEAVAS